MNKQIVKRLLKLISLYEKQVVELKAIAMLLQKKS